MSPFNISKVAKTDVELPLIVKYKSVDNNRSNCLAVKSSRNKFPIT